MKAQHQHQIKPETQSCQASVSGSVAQKVVLMWFGEPDIFNVIDVNYETQKVQVQSEGHAGSFWVDFKDCMSQIQIDWFYIKKASEEVKRLQIKRTILESRSLTDR